MAGKFVTIVNPGYSTLFTRDLATATTTNVENSATMNLFDPDSAHPLQGGEWLIINSAYKFQRPAEADVNLQAGAAGTALSLVDHGDNNIPTVPCFMYYQERGRYDAQVTKKAHCIVGPSNFEFRTKMIVCGTSDVGDRVYVSIAEDAGNRLVSCLASFSAIDGLSTAAAPASGDWYAGVITRVHGTNDATVLFQPGFL
jgi:hypothetical protein